MDKTFLINNSQAFSYSQLVNDLNNKMDYSAYIYVHENDPYPIFLQIIHSLIYQYDVTVLDGDFSVRMLQELDVDIEKISQREIITNPTFFNHMFELIDFIVNQEKWSISLYTSGTTGKPKKITHTLKTITRNVKANDRYKDNIWAFAYNPTHIAGLQVFFQAFFNMNTIIYAFDGEKNKLESLINAYKITNISATSTYYRTALPYLKGHYTSLNYITFGGEKIDPHLFDLVKSHFPNAKIRNIYASTEAGSLFSTQSDLFEISESNRPYFKFGNNNELLIHRSMLGNSESFTFEEDWFASGDLVELIDETHFRFVSRDSDIFNVGGYNVNPNEIENILVNVPGIIDLIIKPRKNPITGNIVVAEVVKEMHIDEIELKKAIKKYASEYLQDWKIPRIINFVDEIEQNRAGKKGRM